MTKSDFTGLIGNTPLIVMPHLSTRPNVRIYAKLESQNPTGSIKDRIVHKIIQDAERYGAIKPGDTIVEASSGNTAIALAMIGKQRNYKIHVVIPVDVAPSIADILKLYGTTVTWCNSRVGMKGAIEIAIALARDNGYYYLDQFDNEANINAHYETTGSEICDALPSVDVFVAGIGTGGTIMGVGRRLREANPNVRLIGVTPRMGERLQGLRTFSEGYVPPLLDLDFLDGRFLVDTATAANAARLAVEKEGILAGISSGATLSVALRLEQDMNEGNIVVMFSDGGWKYLPANPWDAAAAGSEPLDETHWW
jgi:cysteine synthase B